MRLFWFCSVLLSWCESSHGMFRLEVSIALSSISPWLSCTHDEDASSYVLHFVSRSHYNQKFVLRSWKTWVVRCVFLEMLRQREVRRREGRNTSFLIYSFHAHLYCHLTTLSLTISWQKDYFIKNKTRCLGKSWKNGITSCLRRWLCLFVVISLLSMSSHSLWCCSWLFWWCFP